MMKATELRIGNYVLDDTTESIMVVHRLESEKYTEWNSGDEYSIVCLKNGTEETFYEGYFKPIPLTEEILLKCPEYSIRLISKYKCIITFYNFKSDVCVFQQDSKVIRLFCDFRKNTFYIEYGTQKIYFKYLHQLQNLIFALTGEELTVNL